MKTTIKEVNGIYNGYLSHYKDCLVQVDYITTFDDEPDRCWPDIVRISKDGYVHQVPITDVREIGTDIEPFEETEKTTNYLI